MINTTDNLKEELEILGVAQYPKGLTLSASSRGLSQAANTRKLESDGLLLV
jgi:hypothetical protein